MALQGRYRTHDYVFTDAYPKKFAMGKNQSGYPPEADDYQHQQTAANSGAWSKAYRRARPKMKQEQRDNWQQGDWSLR